MLFKFKNLMLEVTRQCNMQCAHCMRGEAQDVKMTQEVISKLLSSVTEIEHLTITGGEPSLVPEVIGWIVKYIRTKNIKLGSFFCATNARKYSDSFVEHLNDLYILSENRNNCVLAISVDQFHENQSQKAMEYYRSLPYYRSEKEKYYIPKGEILSEGRAAQNGLGRFQIPAQSHIYEYLLHVCRFDVGDRVYINALGDVLLNADMSYESQEKYKLGKQIFPYRPGSYLLGIEHLGKRVGCIRQDLCNLHKLFFPNRVYKLGEFFTLGITEIQQNIR